MMQDLRYAVRVLGRSPGFTVVAVVTLALGIGLNTTLFTVFDAVALRPLPVRDAGSVMRLERWFASGRLGGAQYMFSWPEYEFLKSRSHSFSELIAVSNPVAVRGLLPTENGSGSAQPVRLVGELVSANYFSQLATSPAMGRTFAPDENGAPGAHPILVLSHRFWQTRFASDPAVVGRVMTLNGTPFTIVGVAPREFIGTANPPQIPDFWAPFAMQAQLVPGQDWLRDPFDLEVQLIGHEVQVAAPPKGASELSVLMRQFQAAHPNPALAPNADVNTTGLAITTRITLQPATLFGNTEDVRFRLAVGGVMAIVGMVLLVACANVANMLLARATARQREIGVRLALGASRSRLIRQLLTESVVLALLGGAAGLLVSIWTADLVWAAVAPFLIRQSFVIPTLPDGHVFGYAFLVSFAAGIVFGLTPALHASRSNMVSALKDSETLVGRHWRRANLRRLLVAGQVAVSMMFLVSAGLLARGLIRSQSADPGYETKSVYLMTLDFGNDLQQANVRARRAMARLESLPEIADLAVVERPPMMYTWTPAVRAGDTLSPNAPNVPGSALGNRVSASYFRAFAIPLVRGRTFSASEQQFGAPVAVISEATARSLWPGQDPIGKRIDFVQTRNGPWKTFEVIGVAKDVRTANLSRLDPAMAYFPMAESELSSYWLAIRIRGDARSAIPAIGSALGPVDVRFASGFAPLNLEDDVVRTQRLLSQTVSLSATCLALLALVLAAVGIYGVAAFMVSQREHEVGVRMALGASARDVSRLIVADGVRPVAIGGAVGLLGSFAVSAVLRATLVAPASMDFLYGVGTFDPITFVAFPAFLTLVAVTATYLPARRAARVDPMVALRCQ